MHLKTVFALLLLTSITTAAMAQNSPDSLRHLSDSLQYSSDSAQQKPAGAAADDPSQFFTRVELFNELQHYGKKDFYLNQTVLRANIKIGKRFTTRIDIPFVYNSLSTAAEYSQLGIGDISFRLLGYKLIENPKSAITASVEISLNTAASPILGTGKNLVIPVVSYTRVIPRQKILLALVVQQANSVSGDKSRSNISFSKIQAVVIKTLTRKTWVVVAPEWFIDYVHGGLSMNFRSRYNITPRPRINFFATASAGIFGDFAGRYQWSGELGCRYFLLRNRHAKK